MKTLNSIPRFVCAGILLVAAGFKGYVLITDPAAGTLYGSRWLTALLIEYEVLLANWLVSGVAQRWCRGVALGTLAGFAVFASYKAAVGAESCGCFGSIMVNPLWIMGIDCTIIFLLYVWQPMPSSTSSGAQFAVCSAAPVLIGLVLAALIAAPAGQAIADGVIAGDSFVLLEPNEWIGKPFSLFEQIDIGEQLRSGSWRLVLYHHDCSKCQDVIARISQLPASFPPVVLIELPPYYPAQHNEVQRHGRLKGGIQWFVATPAEVTVRDGIVLAVADSESLLGSQVSNASTSTATK